MSSSSRVNQSSDNSFSTLVNSHYFLAASANENCLPPPKVARLDAPSEAFTSVTSLENTHSSSLRDSNFQRITRPLESSLRKQAASESLELSRCPIISEVQPNDTEEEEQFHQTAVFTVFKSYL